ncbi:hypothetical protein RUM44_000017 [Polyplax serrata]|uniref:Mitochondrial ornithine transporter 1 n=1 Tax=Polyplax serrata TaxID=468196 RepID=A0ABR1B509_POLSC
MTHGSARDSIRDGIIDFTAGSLGGIVSVYVGQPLDTIKVKLQTFPHLYKNMSHCLQQTIAKDGFFRGLYAGTLPAVAANVAENSVLFAAYGGCQKFIKFLTNTDIKDDLSVFGNASAGFLAAFFSSFTLCPTELIKCQLQAAREVQQSKGGIVEKISPFGLTKKIVNEQGVRGLFRGLDSTFAREMPGYFVFFGGYELTRTLLTPEGFRKENLGFTGTMLAGAVGGISFWVCIFPADVVKSRLQVSNLQGNLFQLMCVIAKTEGFAALYSGLGPTLIRTIPATASLFLTFEWTKYFLHRIGRPTSEYY